MAKKNKILCIACGKSIPVARLKALKLLGVPPNQWTHVTCSTTKKKQGLFMGEVGTSELKIVDKVYDDSVRSKFTEDQDEGKEEVD